MKSLRCLIMSVLVPCAALAQSLVATDDARPNSPSVARLTSVQSPVDQHQHDTAEPKQAPAEQGQASATQPAAVQAPQAGNALANAVVARTPEEEAKQSGFSLVTTLDTALGTGTFVDPQKYALLTNMLMVQPRYQFFVKGIALSAGASTRFMYEYTMPDSPSGRHWAIGDLGFSLAAPALYKNGLTGIGVTPSIGLTLPMSPESFNAGLIAGTSVGVSLSRSIKTVDLSLALSGRRSFYTNAINAARPGNPNTRDSGGNLVFVCRTGEVACENLGTNPAWGVSANAMVGWRVSGEFELYAQYMYSRSWKYDLGFGADATLSSQAVTNDGSPAASSSPGQSDRVVGVLGVSYQLNARFAIDLAMQTVQAPLTPTKNVRFPFFGFGTLADNSTTFSFTISAGY